MRSLCKGWKPKSYPILNLNFGYDLKVIAIQVVLHQILKELQVLKFRIEGLKIKIKRRAQEMTLEIGERRTPIDVGTEKMT